MKISVLVLLLILLSTLTQTRPWMRQLTDSSTADSDPSTNPDCIEARKLTDCNYSEYKLKRAQVCYDAGESRKAQNQREILFCQQCLKAVQINKLYEEDNTKQTSRHNMNYLDCTQNEINLKRGIIQSAEVTKRVQAAATPFDPNNIIVGATIPATLDYSNYNGANYLTSMKDQGSCGCCWSFAATAVYEGILKKNGFTYELSAQAALQCTSAYAPGKRVSDCSGGYFPDPLTFYSKVGGVLLSSYPYISANYGSGPGFPRSTGICYQTNRIYLGAGTNVIVSGLTTTQIKSMLVTYGPVMVGVYADTGFVNYGGGTYSGCPSNSAIYINHAVLLYGWDSNGNWLIKNQWGIRWGNGGYMTLSSTYDCGMSSLLGTINIANPNSNPQVVMDPGYTSQYYNLSIMVLLVLFFITFLF